MADMRQIYIRKPGTSMYLHTDIDSSGMSVFWVVQAMATPFKDSADANGMIKRLRERYSEPIETVVL